MSRSMSPGLIARRSLLGALGAAPLLAAPDKPVKISAVELWRLQGCRQTLPGVDQRHQAQMLHWYDEHRPRPYRDNPNPQPREAAGVGSTLRNTDLVYWIIPVWVVN